MQRSIDMLQIDEARYDRAVKDLRSALGSFDSIAAKCYAVTGQVVAGNTIRNWLYERKIPIEYAAVFQHLTDGMDTAVIITDFYHWLEDYL